jgi:transposase InsO family protein
LKRNGLVKPRRRRQSRDHRGAGVLDPKFANGVWTIDFKGEFRLGNGRYCYPLTVCDAFSRYILCCKALPSVRGGPAKKRLEMAFRRYGLPEAIRSDNGAPFVGRGLYGLSRLKVWWIKLGIQHDRIRPASPQDNGRHERMHRTLKQYTQIPPSDSFPAQQKRFDGFVEEYNRVRPHQGIGGELPDALYTASQRSYPKRLPKPQYANHLEVRLVGSAGCIRFKNNLLFVSQTLEKERVALEEVQDGLWNLYFYDVLLAKLDERTFKLSP